MYVATSTMNQSTKAMIAFYLFAMALLAAISPSSGRLPLMYRRSVGLHHFEQTSALLSEYQDLATAMKEDVIKILNMSNVSLFKAPNEITEIRFSVNVTCQLKELLETLALSEAAITSDPGQEGGMDIELSAVVIVVGTLYKQSCSWMVKNAQEDGASIDVDYMCTLPVNGSVSDLCAHWDVMQLAEASVYNLQTLLIDLQNKHT